MTEYTIKIPAQDWKDQVHRDESFVKEKQDILDALHSGKNTSDVAIAAIISREEHYAPEDIIRPNKTLLLTGGMLDVAQIARSETKPVTATNGTVYNAPAMVGKVGRRPNQAEQAEGQKQDNDDGGASFVDLNDKLALERARNYLHNTVPGHIWRRLLVVYEGGGDVEAEAMILKVKINELVERLIGK